MDFNQKWRFTRPEISFLYPSWHFWLNLCWQLFYDVFMNDLKLVGTLDPTQCTQCSKEVSKSYQPREISCRPGHWNMLWMLGKLSATNKIIGDFYCAESCKWPCFAAMVGHRRNRSLQLYKTLVTFMIQDLHDSPCWLVWRQHPAPLPWKAGKR